MKTEIIRFQIHVVFNFLIFSWQLNKKYFTITKKNNLIIMKTNNLILIFFLLTLISIKSEEKKNQKVTSYLKIQMIQLKL